MSRFDYLIIGHVTHDLTPAGPAIGGTAAFAGRVAHALGCRTAVLTSVGADFEGLEQALPGLEVCAVPAAQTTTFHNQYEGQRRRQVLHHKASTLGPADLPQNWRRTPIVHLGPVADEVSVDLVHQFTNSMIGLTPQGWLRGRRENGEVYPRAWQDAGRILPMAAAVILSDEDLPQEALLEDYRRATRLLVVTHGAAGATVYFAGEERHCPAPVVSARDLTGAGDIFAAAFLVRLYQTRGNPWEAAEFANRLAAISVTESGLTAKVARIKEDLAAESASSR